MGLPYQVMSYAGVREHTRYQYMNILPDVGDEKDTVGDFISALSLLTRFLGVSRLRFAKHSSSMDGVLPASERECGDGESPFITRQGTTKMV
jgi:hypothetical protein